MEQPVFQNIEDSEDTFEVQHFIQKFSYCFDYPSVIDSGSVEYVNNQIIISFPRKPTVTVNEYFKHNQNIHIFVDKQLVFDLSWIPIYSVWDYVRVHDMLFKGLTEYTNIVQGNYYNSNFNYYPKFCNSIANVYRTKAFYLYSYESEHITSFEIELTKSNDTPNSKTNNHNMCLFQIRFDNNLNFCTEKLFKHLDLPSVHFLVQFLLTKITSKCNVFC